MDGQPLISSPPPPRLVLPTRAHASPPAPDASAWPFRARSTHVSEPSIKLLTALRFRSPEEEHHSHTLKISRQPFRVPLLRTKSTECGKLWGSAVKVRARLKPKYIFCQIKHKLYCLLKQKWLQRKVFLQVGSKRLRPSDNCIVLLRENLGVAVFLCFLLPHILADHFFPSSHLLEYTLVLVMKISSSEGCNLVQWVIRVTPISSGRGCRNHKEDVIRGPYLPASLQISFSLVQGSALYFYQCTCPFVRIIQASHVTPPPRGWCLTQDYTRWIWDVSLIWTLWIIIYYICLFLCLTAVQY